MPHGHNAAWLLGLEACKGGSLSDNTQQPLIPKMTEEWWVAELPVNPQVCKDLIVTAVAPRCSAKANTVSAITRELQTSVTLM